MKKGFGELIKIARKRKKWTQEQLGEKIGGKTKSFVSKIESESTDPSLEMLLKISEALEVDPGDLLPKSTLPKELKDLGVEWIVIGEELEKDGISPEQVKMWAEIVKKHTDNN